MKSHKERLTISVDGNPEQLFFGARGVLLAKGYSRIVIGDRGPYVEFELDKLKLDVFDVPSNQAWRQSSDRSYYIELRSTCTANIKCYIQQKTVDYADYKVGMAYISPFDLLDIDGNPFIKLLKK